jgi:integrase
VLFAVLASTGMELGAALRLTAADIDRDHATIHARGSKTAWRNRVVRYEPWATSYIEGAQAKRLGAVPLFPGIGYKDALTAFKAAQQAVGLSGHRLHDLRHTYAVNALRKGYKPTVIARQLGHKDASMINKVYGRFVPDESDYLVAGSSTDSATSSKKRREATHAK